METKPGIAQTGPGQDSCNRGSCSHLADQEQIHALLLDCLLLDFKATLTGHSSLPTLWTELHLPARQRDPL